MLTDKKLTIRRATLSDVPAIAVILRELGWFPHMKNESQEAIEKRISRHLELCNADESHLVLVAENQNREVVGYSAIHWVPYLGMTGLEGYLSELFVRESIRGKGIGSALLESIKSQAMERGCTRLMLLNGRGTLSYKKNYYKKLGWEERRDMANLIFPLTEPKKHTPFPKKLKRFIKRKLKEMLC